MRRLTTLLTGCSLALGFAGMADAAGLQPALRASCSQGGRIVFREDLPTNAGYNDKMMVSARFPEAVCIFVQIDDVDQPMGPQPVVQDQVLKAPDDTDLATALAMISAGRQSADVGASLPVDLTAVMTPFRSSSPQPTTAAGETINLTIGIYQHMQTSDILAHWKVMQKDSVSLAQLTPILTQAKDITMLSVENVPDTAADQVCQDAAKTSSGCLAYY